MNYILNRDLALDSEDIIINNKKTFARLIARKNFVTQGQLVPAGKKGAYVEVLSLSKNTNKILKSMVKIGEQSWVEGAFGNSNNLTFVKKGTTIGSNSLISTGSKLENNIEIGSNCKIAFGVKIGKNSQIGDCTEIEFMSQIGNNTYIKPNCKIGQSSFIGQNPNHYEKYWHKIKLNPKTLSKESCSLLKEIKFHSQDIFYNSKSTYIGENSQIGQHTRIFKNVVIGNNNEIGDEVLIKQNVVLSHNCIIKSKDIIEK